MDVFSLVLRVVLALAFVAVLLWYIQKRATRGQRGPRSGDALTIISRRGLGKTSSVVVVETDGKRFLLGVTEQAVNVLHTSDVPSPVAVEAPAPVPAPATGKVFALKLAEATGTTVTAGTSGDEQPSIRRHPQRKPSPLDGSILAGSTWKQAGAALRKGLQG